ncbi:winged helix-turn-helix transcriptional regulator [Halopenitus persicus]|uniref:winged helix-turn-helix transcriptional regulator n=1 Tax=Halopenitus persicus TaxID=1048396 RepID=UPI000BBACFD4|nr:helix-turn-helix domain-containing protein [Halopenitus persicus]
MSESEMAAEPKYDGAVDGREFFSLLGKAHTMAILRKIVLGDDQPARFGEIKKSLSLSPNTLSRRLDELVAAGLLQRTQYDEIPPRVEYETTEMLDDLEPTFRELETWMEQYGAEDLGCPE